MNTLSRIITGTVLVIAGFGLIIPCFFGIWMTLIYGIPILILGIIILLNKREDKIEEIKSERRKEKKK